MDMIFLVIQHMADLVQKDAAVTDNKTEMVYVEVKEIDWPNGIPSDCPLDTICKGDSCKKRDKNDSTFLIHIVLIALFMILANLSIRFVLS